MQDSESAQKAVEELNGKEMFGKTLYVSRLSKSSFSPCQGVNILSWSFFNERCVKTWAGCPLFK